VKETSIKEVINRNPVAIEALYDRYAPALLSVCYRYCGNRDDAEDILHDSFIKIIQKIKDFIPRKDASLEAWMHRIAVNTSLNFIRSRTREKIMVDIDPILDHTDFTDETEGDLEELYHQIDRETILALICELPAGYRTVFNLYVFEQYSHAEIAGLLSCSENTSKSQLSKARALLRKKMNQLVNTNTIPTYEKV